MQPSRGVRTSWGRPGTDVVVTEQLPDRRRAGEPGPPGPRASAEQEPFGGGRAVSDGDAPAPGTRLRLPRSRVKPQVTVGPSSGPGTMREGSWGGTGALTESALFGARHPRSPRGAPRSTRWSRRTSRRQGGPGGDLPLVSSDRRVRCCETAQEMEWTDPVPAESWGGGGPS